ncbi:uncharacterized protein [Manis javanica]|uniref:uncharacterized protein n=1 Tax=Manis javanica TaxID=9974 RepID=UPI00187A8196|nr:GTP-binding protein REM 1-like [Manis javanica]KAI5936988.1 Ras-related protein Rap-2c [Manis javanica]
MGSDYLLVSQTEKGLFLQRGSGGRGLFPGRRGPAGLPVDMGPRPSRPGTPGRTVSAVPGVGRPRARSPWVRPAPERGRGGAGRVPGTPVSAAGRVTAEPRDPGRPRQPGARPSPPVPSPPRPSSLPSPTPPSLLAPPPRAIPRCAPAAGPRLQLSAMAGAVPRPAKGYRVVLLGSVAVGKTALATQFACGSFPEQCEPSVEELFSKVIEVNAAPALLEIVDTVGAEHLVTLKDLYIKNSDGFVVLYSVCSEASFEAVRPLRERMGRLRGPRAVPLVLVGTKADLDAERQVLTARGRALAREWRCPFLEVTAKSKRMVDQVFTQVVREMEALAPPEVQAPAAPTNAQDTWPSERFIG